MLDTARSVGDCICNLRADTDDLFREAGATASGRRRDTRGDFRPGAPQASRERLVHACTQDELIAIGPLIDDFPRPMDLGEQLPVAC